MADSQKQGKSSSGGMKLNDHKFFGGSGSPEFPKGVHEKHESSAEGAGSLMRYQDTTEEIKKSQTHAEKKIKGRPMMDNDRN